MYYCNTINTNIVPGTFVILLIIKTTRDIIINFYTRHTLTIFKIFPHQFLQTRCTSASCTPPAPGSTLQGSGGPSFCSAALTRVLGAAGKVCAVRALEHCQQHSHACQVPSSAWNSPAIVGA